MGRFTKVAGSGGQIHQGRGQRWADSPRSRAAMDVIFRLVYRFVNEWGIWYNFPIFLPKGWEKRDVIFEDSFLHIALRSTGIFGGGFV